jgi:hypothetical protein
LLVPQEEAVVLPWLGLREVEVDVKPGLMLDFYEEKQKITELVLKECEVEQQVVCKEMKAVTCKDPETGKCRIDYEPCEVVKTVKVKVYRTEPVCREVVVRVPVVVPGPPLSVRKVVLDELSRPAIKTTFSLAEMENTIHVPVAPPPPPGPPLCPSCKTTEILYPRPPGEPLFPPKDAKKDAKDAKDAKAPPPPMMPPPPPPPMK